MMDFSPKQTFRPEIEIQDLRRFLKNRKPLSQQE